MEKLIDTLSASLGPAGGVLLLCVLGLATMLKILWSRLITVQDSKDLLTQAVVEGLNNASNSMDNLQDEFRRKP